MKIDNLLIYLPERLSKALISLPFKNIKEIRLRANAPTSVTCEKGNITFDSKGNVVSTEMGMILTPAEINNCVTALCRNSRYSFEDVIKNGFIPLREGCRAGVCGKTVTIDGKVLTVSEITSINIRLSSFIPDLAKDLAKLMKKRHCGVLVYSPPGVGKTTYLKSAIHLLSTGKYSPSYRVGVVDERFELSEGIRSNGLYDIISGSPKDYGIELLTRTMSPEIIVCDEILWRESDAILKNCNSGVSFICSIHGNTMESISKRSYTKPLFDAGIFTYAVGIECSGGEYKYTVTDLTEE